MPASLKCQRVSAMLLFVRVDNERFHWQIVTITTEFESFTKNKCYLGQSSNECGTFPFDAGESFRVLPGTLRDALFG